MPRCERIAVQEGEKGALRAAGGAGEAGEAAEETRDAPRGDRRGCPIARGQKRTSRMKMSGRRLGMIRKEEVEEKERFSSTLFV